jgi:DNA relaxase NicK
MRIHWFAFTFFGDRKEFDAVYKEFLANIFGDYVEKDHGGRGYHSICTANCGVRVYFDPVSIGPKGNHCHVELPGEACDCIVPDTFREIMTYFVYGRMQNGQPQLDKFAIKRLDIAFDHEFFSPEQWFQAISGVDVVTLAKRDQIRVEQSPFAPRDDGQIGTMTVYLGSNESGRMLRVYNRRGPTRVELQMRDDRANWVAIDILLQHPSKWHEVGLAHLVQYVTFRENQVPAWWLDFIGSAQSADIKISSSRVVSINKLDNWIKRQVAVALSVLDDVEGEEYLPELIKSAKERDRSRYASLIQMGG